MLTVLQQDFNLNNNKLTGEVPVSLKYLGSSCNVGCNGQMTDGFKLHDNRLCGPLPAEVEDVGGGWDPGSFKVKPRTFIGTTPCDQTSALVALVRAAGGGGGSPTSHAPSHVDSHRLAWSALPSPRSVPPARLA